MERPSVDAYDGRPVDEHTRLLPGRLDSDLPHYLSPDDPAVSPYNLWSVRLVRLLTVILTIVTFLWWVLLLVSLFVTPPGLHTRGSGFFAFSYSSLALFLLIFTLMFFAVPSKAGRIICIVQGVLLLTDTIIILAVEKTRHEEGWVGVASVTWALIIATWALIVDHTVQWGKKEEEERLTGRQETRRTLLEWIQVLLSTVALTTMAVAVVLMTATLVLRALDARLAPPGERYWVDGDKYQIHVYCRGETRDAEGNKVPTVLFEAGEMPVEYGLWAFANDAYANGSIARYCFADRPGYAWSDTAPSPFSASMVSDAISEALSRAGEHGPWILASAGIGSIYSRIFSSRHGKEVQAILMIDPLHEDYLYRVAQPGRGFLLWLRGVLSPLGLDRLPGALFMGRNSEDRVWGQSSSQTGKTIFARLQESLVADSLTKREVVASRAIQYQSTPLVVISSGVQIRKESQWEARQRDLTHLTRNLEDWDIVEKAPHEVWRIADGRQMIEKRLKQLAKAMKESR